MSAAPDWLSRYREGHRDQVWHELRQLGRAVHEPDLAAQAHRVCDEMACRARRNVKVIVGRLTEQGYLPGWSSWPVARLGADQLALLRRTK